MKEILYGGRWVFQNIDIEFNGELLINDPKGIIRLIIYHFDEDNPFADKVIPDSSDIINGTLTNGAKVTLLDCKVVKRHSYNFHRNTIIIEAKYAVNGIEFTKLEDVVFYKMDFEVSNIIAWSGLSGFEYPFYEGYAHTISYKFKEPVIFNIIDIEGSEISIFPRLGSCNYAYDVSKVSLTQSVMISVIHKSPQTIEKSVSILKKVLGLISLGTEKKIDILRVEGYNSSFYDVVHKVDKIDRPIHIFFDNEYKEEYQNLEKHFFLFNLNDLFLGPNKLLIHWFHNYELLEPVIELYLSVINYQDMSLERHFLTIIQALETYHMRFICNKLSHFKERIDKIISTSPNNEQLQNIIFDAAQEGQDYILLKNRLIDLFLAEFQIMFYFNSGQEQFDFIKKAVDTRHYHTHYDLKKKAKSFSGLELEEAYFILKLVLEYYLLTEVGLSPEHIQKKIKEREANLRRSFGRN